MLYVMDVKVSNYFIIESRHFTSSFKSYHVTGVGGKKGAVERCPNCKGSGMQVRIQQIGPGMVQQIQSVCHECQGQGERINAKDRCKVCLGKKVSDIFLR